MNANEVIELYVTEVVLKLPRKQRNDVACELRALIDEGLQDKAEAAGRPLDAEMATEFVRAIGRPADVAARYRPTVHVIDPEDGRAFLLALWIGLAVIWSLGLLVRLQQPIESGWDFLLVLGQWWGATVVHSLWWPGLLVLSFASSAWVRRRWPASAEWKPVSRDRIQGSRASLVLGMVGAICGLLVLMQPTWVLDFFWGGRAAPAAYQALTYTEEFRRLKAPLLFGLVALNIPLWFAVLAKGSWSTSLRRGETALSLALCVVMAWVAWVAQGGPVFMAADSDQFFRAALVIFVAMTLAIVGFDLYREVKPAPGARVHAPR